MTIPTPKTLNISLQRESSKLTISSTTSVKWLSNKSFLSINSSVKISKPTDSGKEISTISISKINKPISKVSKKILLQKLILKLKNIKIINVILPHISLFSSSYYLLDCPSLYFTFSMIPSMIFKQYVLPIKNKWWCRVFTCLTIKLMPYSEMWKMVCIVN